MMAYKSVLSVVTNAANAARELDAAVEFVRREDAHLDVLCIGVDHTDVGLYSVGATVAVSWQGMEDARQEAAATGAVVRTRLEAEDIRWAVETVVSQPGIIGSTVGMRARYADLVILGRPYDGRGSGVAASVLEGALFDGHAPVLIVPPNGLPAAFSSRIVLAWNESEEAMAATRLAMPFLKQSAAVNIAVVEPSYNSSERSDPGGALSQLLARHGVHAEVSVLSRLQNRIADVLLRHATEIGAGMIVMGGYGHSRFREAILGGATRDILESAMLPVFMAR